MQERTLWMHIEPSAEGRVRMAAVAGGPGRPLPVRREEEGGDTARARKNIAIVAEVLDRLESFAAAEVEIIDTENEVEDAGLIGYELGVYLDQLSNETRLDPGEMFGCLYVLLNVLEDSGLYDVELTLDEHEISLDDMLEQLVQIAEEAGYYVGPKVDIGDFEPPRPPAPATKAERFAKAERFFLDQARLGWPCGVLQLKRQWKILAARFHPDRNPDDDAAAIKFRLIKEGYDKLQRRLFER